MFDIPEVINSVFPDFLYEDDTTYLHIIEHYKKEYHNRHKRYPPDNIILYVTHLDGSKKAITYTTGDDEVKRGDIITIGTKSLDTLNEFLLSKRPSNFGEKISNQQHQLPGLLDFTGENHKVAYLDAHINARESLRSWMSEYKKNRLTRAENISFEDFVREKVSDPENEAEWIKAYMAYMETEGNAELRKGGRTRKRKRTRKHKLTRGRYKSKIKTKRSINKR